MITVIKCIEDESQFFSITLGKVYNANEDSFYYELKDDNGDRIFAPKYIFKKLEEIREEKINEILEWK